MNREKCKGCEWYGKPYWSINNPCDNCPREIVEGKIEVFSRYIDPSIEELKQETYKLQQENKQLKDNWNKLKEYIENKLSTDTYQHLEKIYDDIDKTEYIWEEYEFEDILEILKGE